MIAPAAPGEVVLMIPDQITVTINGLPATLMPYSYLSMHPANVGLAFKGLGDAPQAAGEASSESK